MVGHQGSRSQKGETPRHFLGSGPQAPLPNTPFQDREPFTEEKTQGQGRAEQAIGTLLCSRTESLGRRRDEAGGRVHPPSPVCHPQAQSSVSQSANFQVATHHRLSASMRQKERRESQQPGLNTATAPPHATQREAAKKWELGASPSA